MLDLKKVRVYVLALAFSLFFLGSIFIAPALAKKSAEQPADVVILNQTLFTIRESLGPYSPKSRAEHVQTRIIKVLEQPDFDPANFKVSIAGENVNVMAGSTVLTTITRSDADAADAESTEGTEG